MNNAIGKRLIYLLLILAALVSIASGVKNAYRYSQDFQWDAAKALCLGHDPYDLSLGSSSVEDIPELDEFYGYFNSIDVKQDMEANQFPSLLILLFLYTLLPYRVAVVLWIVSNFIFTAAILYLLRKTYMKELGRDEFAILSLLMIAGTPWRNQIGVGQHTLFAFSFFLLAVLLSDKKKDTAAGFALAVSYFKYTLTAPLALIFIYKRKWKSFIISVGIHILLTIALALYLNESFIDMIVKPLKVSSALAGEGSIDISALLSGSGFALIFTGLLMCVLLGLALKTKAGYENENILFAVFLLAALIITYHRSYDFFVLAAVYPGVKILGEKYDMRIRRIFRVTYLILLLYSFFGLRIFSESQPSLVIEAIIYYLFLAAYAIMMIRKPKTLLE